MSLAFVFPGQGSQSVGMGAAWAEAYPAAAAAFEEAEAALDMPLKRLCWEGPEEDLQLTANTQPAILATSVAVLRSLPENLTPVVVAGHSLGEYSAHVAAGTVGFADALRLVRRRGELMQEAVPVGQGAMAAILGLDAETVVALAAEATADGSICAVANFNAPVQTVIAGHREAVERGMELAKERGARRAVPLPVSAPFHSPLMAPAREGLAPLLASTAFADPGVPVMTNVDAVEVTTGEAARDALERQVDGAVRWVESVGRMVSERGVTAFVEIGPGSVLTGLIRRIAPDAAAVSVAQPADLEKLAEVMA